jgi:hypothetical protein
MNMHFRMKSQRNSQRRIGPVAKTVERTAMAIDKLVKMFVDLKQAYYNQVKSTSDKRLRKIETKLKIKSPSESVILQKAHPCAIIPHYSLFLSPA